MRHSRAALCAASVFGRIAANTRRSETPLRHHLANVIVSLLRADRRVDRLGASVEGRALGGEQFECLGRPAHRPLTRAASCKRTAAHVDAGPEPPGVDAVLPAQSWCGEQGVDRAQAFLVHDDVLRRRAHNLKFARQRDPFRAWSPRKSRRPRRHAPSRRGTRIRTGGPAVLAVRSHLVRLPCIRSRAWSISCWAPASSIRAIIPPDADDRSTGPAVPVWI